MQNCWEYHGRKRKLTCLLTELEKFAGMNEKEWLRWLRKGSSNTLGIVYMEVEQQKQ